MFETPDSHCRLCAESTALCQAVSIFDETGHNSGLELKLKWLCIDISTPNNLPKLICLSCFDVLNRTWIFLSQVRGAQEKLKTIYSVKIDEQNCLVSALNIEEKTQNMSFTSHSASANSEAPSENLRDILRSAKHAKTKPEEVIVEVDIPENVCMKRKRNRKKAAKSEVTCTICNREFKYPSLLKHHNTAVHTDRTKDFTCHICGATFYTKDTMASHIVIHEGTKPYKCNYCSKAFRFRSKLKSHILTHTTQKPFPCEVCGKSFLKKQYLKQHEIVHSDSMPFACNICDKRFKRDFRLEAHLRQHTGAKPYRCEHCSRDFTNWSNHYKHMKRRHNVKPEKKEKVIIEDLDIHTIENHLK